ncbi:glycosyltransferase [Kocuria koreensis]|jgi:galactofuranosylgalactofuranosylrhamnosyl-N-acetylglucosaminyl-diphospho-decaprenol beta-1,5/1,6-galactofuranosyltransferase|uniref:Glycosyltransferase n=1 Tax=Rothia koreensis TaxID=592378 RepID=A0A7K1LFR3_9MICC|nr:glycosyltransferase [Rothia koreensis]MUN54036.1 glycosyltransferase [Rothia koreensis]
MSNHLTESKPENLKTLQRVIFPPAEQMDTVPLYVDSGQAAGVQLSTMNGALGTDDSLPTGKKKSSDQDSSGSSATSSEAHAEDFIDRRSTLIRAGSRLSFATYFNAFPASYWKRWTSIDDIRLSVHTQGEGTVIIYKSNARGSLQRVDSRRVTGKTHSTFDLPLKPFGDGGWYWFDLIAGNDTLTLEKADWEGYTDSTSAPGRITLEITTLNKPDFCLNNLRSLAQSPEAMDAIEELLIVDQGNKKVQDEEDFEEVAASLKGKLRIINQSNLGGSGGFSRGMYESVQNGSDYALLLDDDVVVEPESIIRLLTFADLCRKPTIVGGHMFDLYNRTVLHTFGEIVNTYRFQPDLPHEDQTLGHDFMKSNLRNTPWLHRRVDVDYNGWWMDLIPTKVIKELGLALPVFIKWDDAEYGLRAKRAGYHTVSLPGAAVWHVSWIDKDDLVGWQAYFHIRNRIIAALLHSPYERGGRLLRESSYADVKHLISMQYFTEHGRIMALRDVLAGPDRLHEIQPQRLPEIRSLTKQYSDAQFKEDIEEFPEPHMNKPPRNGRGFKAPSYKTLVPWALKTVTKQLVKPVDEETHEHPQAHIAHQDNRWWRMSQYDSALVSNAEGTAVSWYRRQPEQLRTKLFEATRLHADILRNWPSLRKQYREAASRITSLEAWKQTFDQHTDSELKR